MERPGVLVKLLVLALVLLAPLGASSPLGAPENLSATLEGQAVVLAWQGVPAATEYRVYRDGSFLGVANGTTYTDASAAAVGTYWVTALLPGGESPPSNPVQAGPCAGTSADPPFFYVNPEWCWGYLQEIIDDITP